MADDLLFVYSSPGTVDPAEFTDWYDNEHVPNRLATPGFGAVARFRATDGLKPEWLATYEIKPGTLDTPAYKALWENASRSGSTAGGTDIDTARITGGAPLATETPSAHESLSGE